MLEVLWRARRHPGRRLALTVLIGGAAVMWPAGALAASVTPTVVSGNPADCSAAGIAGAKTLTYNSNQSGTADDGTLFVNVSVTPGDNTTFDFTASTTDGTKVLGVLVKGGSEGGNLYDYRPAGTLGDTGLHTPPTGNGNQLAGISHILFCYGTASSSGPPGGGTTGSPGSTPTTTPTTATVPTTTTTAVKSATKAKKKKKHKKHKKHHVKAKKIRRPNVSPSFTG